MKRLRSLRGRCAHSHRGWTRVLLVLWLSPSLAASAQEPPSFAPFSPVWDEIELPVDLGLHDVSKTALLQMTSNGQLDAAALRDGVALVVADPGGRKRSAVLGSGTLADLAVYPRGWAERDVLITAGTHGVELWTWEEESEPAPFVRRHLVSGPWASAERVLVWDDPAPGAGIVLLVWEAATGLVHPLRLKNDGGQFEQLAYPSWALGTTPGPLALLQWNGGAEPELAVGRTNGLQVRSFTGAVVRTFSSASTVALAPFGSSAQGFDRLAWVRETAAGSELVAADAVSLEPALPLPGAHVTSAQACDGPHPSCLALGLTDGRVLVVQGKASGPQTFPPAWVTSVAPPVPAHALPALGEIDLSPCNRANDLLLFPDGTSTACLLRGSSTADAARIQVGAFEFCGFYEANANPPCTGSPSVELKLSLPTTPTAPFSLVIDAYPWPEVPSSTLGASLQHVERTMLPGESEVVMNLTLDELDLGAPPEALVFELLLLTEQDGRQAADVALYIALLDVTRIECADLGSCDVPPCTTFTFPATGGPSTRGVTPIPGPQGHCSSGNCP